MYKTTEELELKNRGQEEWKKETMNPKCLHFKRSPFEMWNLPFFLYPMTYIRGGWGEASKLRNGEKKEGEGTEKQLINPLKGL